MKEVFALIDEKKQEFAQLPLFQFLQDKSIDPRQRLVFAPLLAPLAMGFGELCNTVFREEPTTDKIQELINRHTYEEHFHWKWLLEDIEKLGLNQYLRLTDAMLFLLGEETQKSRAVCSRLKQYTFQADPVIKLAVVEVTEVTANVFFELTKPIILELQPITKKEYPYFGMCHKDKEDNHHMNTPEVSQSLKEIELSEETREKACELVKLSFEAYTEAMNEFLAYALAHPTITQPLMVA